MKKSAFSRFYCFSLAVVLAVSSVVLSIGTVAAEPTKVVTYYHNNLQGSPFVASDENSVLWNEQYSPFGYRVGETGGGDPKALNEIGYTGHVEEKYLPNQLIYAKGRFYDPTIGRFLSMDAVDFHDGNPQSFNRYAYANNNPYKYIDPDGNLFFLAYPLGILALATLDIAIGVALDNNDNYQNGQLARVDFLPGPLSGPTVAGFTAGRVAASTRKLEHEIIVQLSQVLGQAASCTS